MEMKLTLIPSAFLRRALAVLAACVLLPACAATPTGKPDEAYAKEAWAYFKKKCETEAGEKIYKTFTGVKSVLVVKPLPPATEKDLYDQFWMGDPYSDSLPVSDRGDHAAAKFIGDRNFTNEYAYANTGYNFVELRSEQERVSFSRIAPLAAPPLFSKSEIAKPESRYGVEWNDISTSEDRKHWVAASRLRILDLADSSVIAERVGFLIEPGFGSIAGQRRPWIAARGPQTTCPSIPSVDLLNRLFVLKVLRPARGESNGK